MAVTYIIGIMFGITKSKTLNKEFSVIRYTKMFAVFGFIALILTLLYDNFYYIIDCALLIILVSIPDLIPVHGPNPTLDIKENLALLSGSRGESSKTAERLAYKPTLDDKALSAEIEKENTKLIIFREIMDSNCFGTKDKIKRLNEVDESISVSTNSRDTAVIKGWYTYVKSAEAIINHKDMNASEQAFALKCLKTGLI